MVLLLLGEGTVTKATPIISLLWARTLSLGINYVQPNPYCNVHRALKSVEYGHTKVAKNGKIFDFLKSSPKTPNFFCLWGGGVGAVLEEPLFDVVLFGGSSNKKYCTFR